MSMPRLLDEDLVRAAELLEQEAAAIRRSFTVGHRWVPSFGGRFNPRDRYDEMKAIARRFRQVAGRL